MRNEEWLQSSGSVLEKRMQLEFRDGFFRLDGFDFGRYSLDEKPERIVSFI
jgi:hypothetical protein